MSLCVLVLPSPAIFGQNAMDLNNSIEILKLHWEKQVRLPRNFDPSASSTGAPFNDPTARTAASGPATAIDATRAATSAQNAAAGASTASGKTVTFTSQLRSPPTRIVQVSDTHQRRPNLAEHAVVQCVLYADETTWRNPQAAPDLCELLANARPVRQKGRSRQN